MVLTGTEIKSIREGKANLQDGYCYWITTIVCKGYKYHPIRAGYTYNREATQKEIAVKGLNLKS
jgi:SsrA-binding protein